MKVNMRESRQQTERELGIDSGPFKPNDGANKFRVLSPFVGRKSYFDGKPTFKYVVYIYSYDERRVCVYFMPPTIYKAIESLQESEDYRFDEVPMPYDLTLNVKNAGKTTVDYQLLPARNESPVPVEASEAYARKKTIFDVVKELNEKDANDPSKQPRPEEPTIEPVEEDDSRELMSDDEAIALLGGKLPSVADDMASG